MKNKNWFGKFNLKQRMSSVSTRRKAMSVTMRMAVLPLIPLTITPALPQSAADSEQPPSTSAVLAVRTAPEQMAAGQVVVSVAVGASRSEEAAAAPKKTTAVNTASVERIVMSRYREDRANGGLTLEEARAKTVQYAAMYGVDAALMAKVVACESGYNQFAHNRSSSAAGYGQFLDSTWRSTARALGWDESVTQFDGDKNLQATAYLMSVRGTGPWASSKGCWSR